MNGDRNDQADRYVLGLWDQDAEAIEETFAEDAELARFVGESRDRFLPLDDTADPVTPSASLWPRITNAISTAAVVPFVPVASGAPARAETVSTPGMGHRLMPFAFAASIALSAGLGWMVYTTPQPEVVAVLVNDDGTPFALVGTNDRNVTEVTILSAIDIPDGRVMQVWTKPDSDGPPVSVGLIEQVRSLVLRSPELPAPTTEQLYEITIEQEGGSPTGLPTGEILGKGFTQPRL